MSSLRRAGLAVLAALAAGGAVLILYWPSLRVGYLGDDLNEIADALSSPPFGRISEADVSFFRPLFRASLWLDHELAPGDARFAHAVNLVWFTAGALLLGVVARLVGRSVLRWTGRRSAALGAVATALFVVHPSHTEAVVWISARSDLMVTVAVLGASAAVLARPAGRRAPWIAAVLAAAAVATKESGVAVAPLVTLAAYGAAAAGPGRSRRAWVRSRPTWLGVGLVLLVRWVALGSPVAGYGSSSYVGRGARRIVEGAVSVSVRSVLPPLHAPWWIPVACAAAGALLFVVGLASPARRVLVGVGVAAALSLAPVVPLGASMRAVGGERLVYLATCSVSMAVAVAVVQVGSLGRRQRALPALVAVVGLLVGAEVAAVRGSLVDWTRAGRVATKVLEQASTWRKVETRYVLVVPGDVRGATAARNLLPGGLALTAPLASTEVIALGTVSLPADARPPEIRVVRRDPLVVEVRADRWSADLGTGLSDDGQPIEVTEVPDGYRVRFGPLVGESDVWVFDGRGLRRLDRD